jgi:hypothetical protein
MRFGGLFDKFRPQVMAVIIAITIISIVSPLEILKTAIGPLGMIALAIINMQKKEE